MFWRITGRALLPGGEWRARTLAINDGGRGKGEKMNLCRKWSFGVSWPRSRTLRDPARRGGRVKKAKLLFLVFFRLDMNEKYA